MHNQKDINDSIREFLINISNVFRNDNERIKYTHFIFQKTQK